jgi:hypothetical protein
LTITAVEFAREFVSILRTEDPEAYARMLEIGRGMCIGVRYGQEEFRLEFGSEVFAVVEVGREEAEVDFRCRIEPEIFFSIVDGKTLLSEALWMESLDLVGSSEKILRVYQIAEIVLGTLRGSPSFTSVIARFRRSSLQRPEEKEEESSRVAR